MFLGLIYAFVFDYIAKVISMLFRVKLIISIAI